MGNGGNGGLHTPFARYFILFTLRPTDQIDQQIWNTFVENNLNVKEQVVDDIKTFFSIEGAK